MRAGARALVPAERATADHDHDATTAIAGLPHYSRQFWRPGGNSEDRWASGRSGQSLAMRDDRPSATALLIAKSQLMLAQDPALSWAIGRDRARIYGACMDAVAGGRWRLTASARRRLALQERLGVPGIYLHYALRKLLIARIVDSLVRDQGIRQVVVVAAGFDPLCVLLHHAHPTVRWYEIDHPATQRHKAAALGGLPTGGNLVLLPIDLTRQSIADSLRAGRLSPGAPTLVIAEGITMYLTEEQIRR